MEIKHDPSDISKAYIATSAFLCKFDLNTLKTESCFYPEDPILGRGVLTHIYVGEQYIFAIFYKGIAGSDREGFLNITYCDKALTNCEIYENPNTWLWGYDLQDLTYDHDTHTAFMIRNGGNKFYTLDFKGYDFTPMAPPPVRIKTIENVPKSDMIIGISFDGKIYEYEKSSNSWLTVSELTDFSILQNTNCDDSKKYGPEYNYPAKALWKPIDFDDAQAIFFYSVKNNTYSIYSYNLSSNILTHIRDMPSQKAICSLSYDKSGKVIYLGLLNGEIGKISLKESDFPITYSMANVVNVPVLNILTK